MGGGISMEGLGCPGSNDEPGEGFAGRPLAGPPGAEVTGDDDEDPGPTQAAIDHAKARTTMTRAAVRISA
jgi:hypothetical protein